VHNIFLKPTIILFCIAIPAYIIARAALRKKTAGIDISVGRELLYFTFFVYLIGLISVTIVPPEPGTCNQYHLFYPPHDATAFQVGIIISKYTGQCFIVCSFRPVTATDLKKMAAFLPDLFIGHVLLRSD
jgi:hypothetical protein